MAGGIYAGTTLPDNSRPMLMLDVGGIATAAGIGAAAPQPVENVVESQEAAAVPTLLFLDLDGVLRGIRLALVERIEDVPARAVIEAGGARLLQLQDRLIPLRAIGALPADGRLRVLRLTDGTRSAAYAIRHVSDVVETRAEMTPAGGAGPVAGVMLHAGEPVEMLDPFWLFASASDGGSVAGAPLCLVAEGGDAWAREVLAPLLGVAGYRVAFAGEPVAEPISVVIVAGGAAPKDVRAPVIRLRASPGEAGAGDGSVYRYDREALLGRLRLCAAGGR
jgi:two-component system, chemotaxis family, sensor kinase CheA